MFRLIERMPRLLPGLLQIAVQFRAGFVRFVTRLTENLFGIMFQLSRRLARLLPGPLGLGASAILLLTRAAREEHQDKQCRDSLHGADESNPAAISDVLQPVTLL